MTRVLSRILIGTGVLLLAWVILVWQWQDPFTALYTHWQQDKLGDALDKEFAAFTPLRTAGVSSALFRDAPLHRVREARDREA